MDIVQFLLRFGPGVWRHEKGLNFHFLSSYHSNLRMKPGLIRFCHVFLAGFPQIQPYESDIMLQEVESA